MLREELIPSESRIFGWIEEIFSQGVRRPGYPADRWAEQSCLERFREFGLENARLETVELPYWEPRRWSLTVWPDGHEGQSPDLPCFPLPHAAPVDGLEAELTPYDAADPGQVRGRIALYDVRLNRPPHALLASRATWSFDPDASFASTQHVLPFGPDVQRVMEPAIEAGAVAFVGALAGYPSDSHEYYVPYDAVERPIPGVWISGSEGERLRGMLSAGRVFARLTVDSVREPVTCYNVVAELPGADEDIVIIGSHHDGPWASAVEDASGIALVLAQAAYWSQVTIQERPHRLLFLLNAGHMAAGAGVWSFIERHRAELARVVLEVHLEHAANECVELDGRLVPTGQPEARWWFTSRIPALEAAVREAIEAEDLRRSLILPPTFFGTHPTTDGGPFHTEAVPLVNFLTAPFYLFDSQDTLDKIHRESLVPLTRATVRIIESTGGRSAAAMREGVAATTI